MTKGAGRCFPEVWNVNKEAAVKISRWKTVKVLNWEVTARLKVS